MGNRKIKIILPDTLGDPKLYPALNGLSNLLNDLDNKNKQRYVCCLITEFNTFALKAEKIEDKEFRSYILRLIKDRFVNLVDNHVKSIHPDVHSHTRNFIIAKSRKMIRDAQTTNYRKTN